MEVQSTILNTVLPPDEDSLFEKILNKNTISGPFEKIYFLHPQKSLYITNPAEKSQNDLEEEGFETYEEFGIIFESNFDGDNYLVSTQSLSVYTVVEENISKDVAYIIFSSIKNVIKKELGEKLYGQDFLIKNNEIYYNNNKILNYAGSEIDYNDGLLFSHIFTINFEFTDEEKQFLSTHENDLKELIPLLSYTNYTVENIVQKFESKIKEEIEFRISRNNL
jgi:hypothetical protein